MYLCPVFLTQNGMAYFKRHIDSKLLWQNTAKGSNAEVDYLRVRDGVVLPVEVKASTQGAMQSLWVFMRKRKLEKAVRTSLENFGQFEYFDADPEADGAVRHVYIVPLYALSNLRHTAEDFRNMISRETMELETGNVTE